MVIQAAIEAKLLGLRLLDLNADIAVLPARTDGRFPREHRVPRSIRRGELLEAARRLDASAAELESARREMP